MSHNFCSVFFDTHGAVNLQRKKKNTDRRVLGLTYMYLVMQISFSKQHYFHLLFILGSLIVSKNHTGQRLATMGLEFMHTLYFLRQLPKLNVTILTGCC